MIKKSIRLKLTLSLVAFVLLILVISLVISKLFLGDFYLYGKKHSLEEAYLEINKTYSSTMESLSANAYSDNENEFEDISVMEDRFEQMAENTGMSILIYRDMGKFSFNLFGKQNYAYKTLIYSSIGMEQKDTLENNNMYNDYVGKDADAAVLKAGGSFVISRVYVPRISSNYVYLSAELDNGDYLLLRSSYQSVDDSVEIAISFLFYVSVIMLIIGAAGMIWMTKRMTQPITELSSQAKKIAELKFDTRYEVKTQDELGELGNSINYLSDSLERVIGELKTANAQLMKDLEIRNQTDQMRKEFLSNVSHELKTPIALVQGYAEGLMDNINDDEESRQFYCEVIVDEAGKMNNIVKKLLDLNQLEFGNSKLNVEHFDVVETIRNYLENSQILMEQKGVKLITKFPETAYVWSDVYMVEEVFNNYFSNAMNHVKNENEIHVSVLQNDENVRVEVFNTGDWIPEADIDLIWDKFYKVDKARTREYGGSGVGLSIVKATMDRLGQKYGVQNVDGGVMFFFELDSKID